MKKGEKSLFGMVLFMLIIVSPLWAEQGVPISPPLMPECIQDQETCVKTFLDKDLMGETNNPIDATDSKPEKEFIDLPLESPNKSLSKQVLFEDNFDTENEGIGLLDYDKFQNWEVTQGTVDLIGNGFWDFFPDQGLHIDLDGTTQQAGTLVSKTAFRLEPGNYQLQFDLAGNPYSGPNTIIVRLGKVYQEEFHLEANAPFATISREIPVASPASAKLVFQHTGGDNEGLFLDNVKLTKLVEEIAHPPEVAPPPPAVEPPPVQEKSPEHYERLSKEALEAKEYMRLEKILNEGLGKFPENSKLWKLRAHYFFKHSPARPEVRKKETLVSSLKAYEIDPSATNAIDVGWVYQRLFRDCYSANYYYEKGVEAASKKPQIYYFMALCYEESFDDERAVNFYEKFLQAAPNDPLAHEARNRMTVLKGR